MDGGDEENGRPGQAPKGVTEVAGQRVEQESAPNDEAARTTPPDERFLGPSRNRRVPSGRGAGCRVYR
jgi:hypothetical protein